jgi:DNA polymerase
MRRASNVDIFPDQEDDGQGYSWWERTRKGWARTWGSKLTADIIQSLARVVIASAHVKVAPKYKIALQVHDELIAVVPIGAAEEARALMETTLRTPPAWCSDIPLEAEVIVSERYDK